MTSDEDIYDVIVVGSGGGGLVGAYAAASRGLRTLVVEKTDRVGGTTAYSGGGLWFPGSAPVTRAGWPNDVEQSRAYLRAVIADDARIAHQDAFLATAVALIDELEADPNFGEFVAQPTPDYFADAPGASPIGHTIFAADIAAAELGELAELVRDPLYTERRGIDPGPILTGGRALVARALAALLATGRGQVRVETALDELIVEDGVVTGIVASTPQGRVRLHARLGVILAAGGFEHNAELRAQHQLPELTGEWSNGAPGNTGDALRAGIEAGAATELLDEAWFVPGILQPDGRPAFHTGTRGGIWINAAGERFVNEVRPYDQSGHVIYRRHKDSGVSHVPTWWILDQHQLDRDGFGGHPADGVAEEWFRTGALRRADTLEELAELTGIDAARLRATIERFNGFATAGVDEDFHRGQTPWDQFFHHVVGYPTSPQMAYPHPLGDEWPNPLLVPLEPPYYLATVLLSDIGTKGGLVTDPRGRVLRPDGTPIPRLYAAGNTSAPWTGRVYPGAGGPIGSSTVFSYLAALDLAAAATGAAAGSPAV